MYPYAQVIVLILCQLGIVSLCWKGTKFQNVFETPSLNVVSLAGDMLILVIKLMTFVSLIMGAYNFSDLGLINMGWAIIAPRVLIQVIQNLYATGAQLAHIKTLFVKIKMFMEIATTEE